MEEIKMKKNEIIKMAIEYGAMENENGALSMTKKMANNFMWDCDPNIETHIDNQNNVLTLKHKNIIVPIEIVTKKTKSSNCGGHGHKTKNDNYIVEIKFVNEKMETITNMKTCMEIKTFIKSINKKNVEILHVYDSLKNECRKSCWIDKTPKNDNE